MKTQHVSRRRSAPGFTLLEMMIVLVIIGVLGGVVAWNLVGASGKAKEDATIQKMRQISDALSLYSEQYNNYPYDLAVLGPAGVNYLKADGHLDAWKNPIEVVPIDSLNIEGKPYVLRSFGANGLPDDGDDLIYPDPDEQG